MRFPYHLGGSMVTVALACLPALAQQPARPASPTPAAAPVPPPAPGATTVAATVNGKPILESVVQRGLGRVPPEKRPEFRSELINILIDNLLVDEYLLQLNIAVEPKEVEARVQKVRDEIKKEGKTFEEFLQKYRVTEDELRTQITADLRWDKFCAGKAVDQSLREFFDANKEMFDGSTVHARHILLTPASNNAEAGKQAKAQLLLYKKQVEDQVAAGMAKLPASADNLAREQARTKLMDDAFAALAHDKSSCPSKARGGDVGDFPRIDGMVEPFARAAFALKPFQMSDVVQTQFGYHLILCTGRRPGKETKFEEVKDDVRDVYSSRLRDNIASQLRQQAQVVINAPPKL